MTRLKAKYDTIGKTYNQTRSADPYLLKRLYKHLNPSKEGRYLDIGCGSGNYTSKLHELGIEISGIDPSIEMLEKARFTNQHINYSIGVAENINLPNASIDGVIAFLTIHHWQNLEKGFKEIGRILKSGGRLVIFHSTPNQMEAYWLNSFFPLMMQNSMKLMPSMNRIDKALISANLKITNTEEYFMKDDLQDLFLQCGKNNPEIYFRPEIRAGISSFAAVANQHEVKTGLKKLRQAIDTNTIDDLISSYDDQNGDYIFIIAEKLKTK